MEWMCFQRESALDRQWQLTQVVTQRRANSFKQILKFASDIRMAAHMTSSACGCVDCRQLDAAVTGVAPRSGFVLLPCMHSGG
jgi:hypothetical protein